MSYGVIEALTMCGFPHASTPNRAAWRTLFVFYGCMHGAGHGSLLSAVAKSLDLNATPCRPLRYHTQYELPHPIVNHALRTCMAIGMFEFVTLCATGVHHTHVKLIKITYDISHIRKRCQKYSFASLCHFFSFIGSSLTLKDYARSCILSGSVSCSFGAGSFPLHENIVETCTLFLSPVHSFINSLIH